MQTYTNTSNTARAAKNVLAKDLGLDKKEVVRGTHFEIKPATTGNGFIWVVLTVEVEEVKTPAKGIKIEKNREEQNGYIRPSQGGVCAQIWGMLDAFQTEHDDARPLSEVKAWADENGISRVTAQVQYYTWRKFMGYRGRQRVRN